MSVINQMLRDLEQRRAQGLDHRDGILENVHLVNADDVTGRRNVFVWLLLLVLVGLVIYLLWERSWMTQNLSGPIAATPPVSVEKQASRPQPVTPIKRRQAAAPAMPETTTPVPQRLAEQASVPVPPAQTVVLPEATVDAPQATDVDAAPGASAAAGETSVTKPEAVASGDKPEETAQQASVPVSVPENPFAVAELSEPQQWLGSRQHGYTLQLMGNASAERLESVARKLALTDAAIIPTFGSNQWYILVQGDFVSRQAAMNRAAQLPGELQQAGAFPRQLAGIEPNTTLEAEQPVPAHGVSRPTVTAKPDKVPATAEQSVAAGQPSTPRLEKKIRPETAAQRAERLYHLAIREIREGHQQSASETLRGVLAIKPDYHPAREALAGILVNSGRSADAIPLLRQGLALDTEASQFAKLLARLLIDRDEPAAAIQVLESYRPAIATDPDYHAMLAALYQRSRRADDAAVLYRQLVQFYPDRHVWWIGLGIASEASNSPEQAMKAFRRARELPGMTSQMRQFVERRLASLGG